MNRLAVIGTQWGDEGKGKISNYLSNLADCVVRFQGGANAGHTVIANGVKHSFHLLPSGIINPNCINILANGMVIDPVVLKAELENVKNEYKLYVSDRATIVLPIHKHLDIASEAVLSSKIGTTGRGIGPAYSDKLLRVNLKVAHFVDLENLKENLRLFLNAKEKQLASYNLKYDLETLFVELLPYAIFLKPLVCNTSKLLNDLISQNKKIVFEGAQGALLDIEHGTYPYVTSSSPCASSIPINCGIAPWLVDGCLGITKAYTTRVGNGPFPTEMFDELSVEIRERGHEYGVTTGRPRRIGWLDLVLINHTKQVSGLSYIALMLLDVLSGLKTIKICTHYLIDNVEVHELPVTMQEFNKIKPVYLELPGWSEDITNVTRYEDLPKNAKNYIKTIEKLTSTKVIIVSVGPNDNQTILRGEIFDK